MKYRDVVERIGLGQMETPDGQERKRYTAKAYALRYWPIDGSRVRAFLTVLDRLGAGRVQCVVHLGARDGATEVKMCDAVLADARGGIRVFSAVDDAIRHLLAVMPGIEFAVNLANWPAARERGYASPNDKLLAEFRLLEDAESVLGSLASSLTHEVSQAEILGWHTDGKHGFQYAELCSRLRAVQGEKALVIHQKEVLRMQINWPDPG